MSEYSPTAEETNFSEDLESFVKFEHASTGQRFLNWLIDLLFMRFALDYLTGSLVGYMLGSLAPDFARQIIYGDDKFDLFLITYLVLIIDYLLYYTICEKAFKGYSLGKIITG